MGDNAVSSREGCDSPVDITACPLGGQVLRRAARVAWAHAGVELQRLVQHQAAVPAVQISTLASGGMWSRSVLLPFHSLTATCGAATGADPAVEKGCADTASAEDSTAGATECGYRRPAESTEDHEAAG